MNRRSQKMPSSTSFEFQACHRPEEHAHMFDGFPKIGWED
jgi:hypothetical protein